MYRVIRTSNIDYTDKRTRAHEGARDIIDHLTGDECGAPPIAVRYDFAGLKVGYSEAPTKVDMGSSCIVCQWNSPKKKGL